LQLCMPVGQYPSQHEHGVNATPVQAKTSHVSALEYRWAPAQLPSLQITVDSRIVLSPQLLSSTHVTSLLSEKIALRQAPALQLTLLLVSKLADWQDPTTVEIPVLSHSTLHCEKLDCTHEPLSHVCSQLTEPCPWIAVKRPTVNSSTARSGQCDLRNMSCRAAVERR
jgi:hypothetical protein